MFFKTKDECTKWINQAGFDLQSFLSFEREGGKYIKFDVEEERYRPYVLAKTMVSWMSEFTSCFFYVTEHGIWPSSENLHLYYQLRKSYGEIRELRETPGQLFKYYENYDLITFLGLAIQFGWGVCVLPVHSDIQIYVSHDGWVLVYTDTKAEQVASSLDLLSIQYSLT